MTTDYLKTLIHERINLLENPADLNDLLEIVTIFVDDCITPMPDETPTELDRLRKQLRNMGEGRMQFIPHEQVMQESKQFIEECRNR